MLIVKTASAAIFEVCFGKTSKRVKLRRPNVIAQSTMRGGHVYCVHEKAIRSFNIDFTCTHGGGNDCKRHVQSIRHKDYESFEEIPAVLFKVSGSKVR